MSMDDIISECLNLREWVDTFVKEALENAPKSTESLESA